MKREENMSRLKDKIIGMEEQIFAIDGIEDKFSEAEDISEVNTFVINALELTSSFDIETAKEIVSEQWNEFWSNII